MVFIVFCNALLQEDDFPKTTIVGADVDDDSSFLQGCQVVFYGVFGFSDLVGQAFAGDFGVGYNGVDDGLGGFSDFFLGNIFRGFWVNFLGEIFGFWVNFPEVGYVLVKSDA